MKYWCKYCGCIVDVSHVGSKNEDKTNFDIECPICAGETNSHMELMWKYETPMQYEKRTGKEYPQWGYVWVWGLPSGEDWQCVRYRKALREKYNLQQKGRTCIIVVAGIAPPKYHTIRIDGCVVYK